MEHKQAKIIDGRKISRFYREQIGKMVVMLREQHHVVPGLALVRVGDDPASEIYVRNKIKYCRELQINAFEYHLPVTITEKHLLAKINMLNHDPKIHGIIVQLPLPKTINSLEIISSILPEKDVDGFHPVNLGKLMLGNAAMAACTPKACLRLIKTVREDLSGLKAIVIGRSNIVGKPMLHMLLAENCTVTSANSYTRNLAEEARQNDIVIAAVGKPGFITREYIKPGAIVIDVGINKIVVAGRSKLVGDVDFENVKMVAGAVSPVPGGVGPMTVACLLENTVGAVCRAKGIQFIPSST